MKKLTSLLVIICIFAVLSPVMQGNIAAQTQSGSNYLPHIFQIRAQARNNLIRLTWVDSPDAHGPVYIFRSTRPFTGSVPPNIRPVIVGYGQQSYIDDTDDLENLYYFIAASDTFGRRFDIVIPQINTINTAFPASSAAIEAHAEDAQTSVRVPVQVSALAARQDEDKVIITYNLTEPHRNAILYRSMRPIRQPHDLLNAVIVQSGFTSPFADFPIPGITWYYAVVYEDDISTGNISIRAGVNATEYAVEISAEQFIERPLRPIPLPAITLNNNYSGFFPAGAPQRIPLRVETERLIEKMQTPPKAPLVLKTPRVFTVDFEFSAGGEESMLFQIVNDYFGIHDWEGARDGLRYYLSLPRSMETEVRARFYLAQTFYYIGNYREALLEFLYVKSHYPEEADSWIDAVLSLMTQ